jgi:SOS-response transcriptional repressor LexA
MNALLTDDKTRVARLERLIANGQPTLQKGQIASFARRHDLDPNYVWQLLNGVRSFGEKAARKMENQIGLPRKWLDQPIEQGTLDLPEAPNVEPAPGIKGRLPLISWVQAGEWSEVIDNFQPGDAEDWLDCPVPHSPRSFCLRVKGVSMLGPQGADESFPPGTIIFIDPEREALPGHFVIVKMPHDNEATFKKLISEGGKLYLEALNPGWPNRFIELPQGAQICGVMIFSGRRWV